MTPHFSSYAVGYSNISFSDVSGWYADAVNFLAAREIISGTGDGTFDPNANITRAQFVTILAKLSGDSLSGYTASSFTDASASDWYFGAAQWAYENGVGRGRGRTIRRECDDHPSGHGDDDRPLRGKSHKI